LRVVFFSAQPLTKPGEKMADAELLAKAIRRIHTAGSISSDV
jgi:hypothetical protein